MSALQKAYDAIANSRKPEPQVVAIVAESGLGKTRIVQEFYKWLAIEQQGDGDPVYWPLELARTDDDLRIDPDPSDCLAEASPKFLWWGARMQGEGRRNSAVTISVLNGYAERFVAHLEHIFVSKRKKERSEQGRQAFRKFLVDVGADLLSDMIPGLGTLMAINSATWNFIKVREAAEADRAMTPTDRREQRIADLSAQYLAGLEIAFGKQESEALKTPFVFVIDDAQWAARDPALLRFVDALLSNARLKFWPVLLVVTHWEREWNEQSSLRKIIENHVDSDWQPMVLQKHNDLSPCVVAAFPGLSNLQVRRFVAKADGNALLMDQMLAFFWERPRFFENLDRTASLLPIGVDELEDVEVGLHDLVRKRLNDEPEIKAILALASIQGPRFVIGLTQELVLLFSSTWETREALEKAEFPLGLVKCGVGGAAEFVQRVYYEVARESVADVRNVSSARAELGRIITNEIRLGLESRSPKYAYEVCRVGAAVFYNDPTSTGALVAALSLTCLVRVAQACSDWDAAYTAAARFEQGRAAGRWEVAELDIGDLLRVLDVLQHYDAPNNLMSLAAAILTFARERQSRALGSKIDGGQPKLSESQFMDCLLGVGDIARESGDLATTDTIYSEALEFVRAAIASGRNAQRLRNLCLVLNRVGKVSLDTGDFERADECYREYLVVSREIEGALPRGPGSRYVAIALKSVADVARLRGDFETAEKLYVEALDTIEVVPDNVFGSAGRRALIVAHIDLGDVVRHLGRKLDALAHYDTALDIADELFDEEPSLRARRDLAGALGRAAQLARRFGNFERSELLYLRLVEIERSLFEILKTEDVRQSLARAESELAAVSQRRLRDN